MGKQKRRKPRHPVADWSTAEEIALLSYLDHCIKHSEVDFEQTVTLHLNRSYTFEQCDRKLWALWNRIGPDHPPGISLKHLREDQNIYTRGTACLHGLDEEYRQEIARATQQLEDELVAKQLSTPGRRLRSSSRLARSQSVQSPIPKKPRPTNKAKSRSQTYFSQTQAQSLTPSRIKQESRHLTSTPSEKSVAGQKRKRLPGLEQQKLPPEPKIFDTQPRAPSKGSISKTYLASPSAVVDDSFEDRSTSTLSEILSEQENDAPDTLAPTREHSQDHQHDGVSTRRGHARDDTPAKYTIRCICGATKEIAGKKEDWISCERCQVWQHTKCVEYFCERCLPNDSNPSHDGGDVKDNSSSQGDTRLRGAISEIETLREELRGKEADLKDQEWAVEQLEKEISRMHTARKQRDAQHSWPMEEALADNLKKINDLHIELDNRYRLSTFGSLKVDSRKRFAQRQIDDQFDQIYRDAQQIMCGHDDDKLPFTPELEKNTALRDLVSEALEVGDTQYKANLQNISSQALIRALTTAVLREWVFETDFPRFGDESSKALSQYRTSILGQDGPLALRNLDLSSLDSQVNDDTFQKQTISTRAAELAVQLSKILTPFFSNTSAEPSESNWDGFATWGDDEETWQARKFRLNEIFRAALTAKADSCLNLEDYEMVIFEPGTKYDKNIMNVETMEGMECIQGKFDGRVVQFCVQAAIYIHPRKALSSNSSVAEAVIPMRNFVKKTERERATVRPLVKAVVVLAD